MILIAALIIAVMYTTLRRALFDDLQSHILDTVKIAALQVDGNAHLQLTKEEDM